ncbi:MT-A70 family methyltransferase [Rhodopseudomonas palustris]|uniref:MT-A70 family methyltransferase n=1 Tax=Rhodopseudomonas palustris TaxID=1076 RepID=UPI0022F07C8E|nr:MT-A70 family methyltransferase [Rhodopseudomonas palustris]WBU27543.1 MT-A70 family methyltransferase [Rhodopseudomonas palustris]
MDWPFGNLRPLYYDVVVADVPAYYETYSERGQLKSAHAHYDCMPLEDIMALPVDRLVRSNSLLLLWAWGWSIATCQAHRIARAWGFIPITTFTWRKVTPNGKVRMGPGYRVRTTDEHILLCTMGNPDHKPFRSFDGIAREHSRKPDEFYQQVIKCTPRAFRADLFSREIREGFDGWGDELGKFNGIVRPKRTKIIAPPSSLPLFGDLQAPSFAHDEIELV